MRNVATDFKLREAIVPGDTEQILHVCNQYDTEPEIPEEFERLHQSWNPHDPRLRLVAESAEGEVVGVSHCRRRASMVAGSFFLSVHVDQTHIGKGIGSRLASEGERFAKANGCERLTAFVTEADAHGRAFAEKRGYMLGRHLFESVMSTDRWTEDEIDSHVRAAQTSGVRFTTLADVGYTEESKRLFFELSDECDLDEPGTVEFGAQTFEDYERNVFGAPWFQPEGVFLAIADGQWAGIHTIGELKDSDIADFTVDFTGVRRPFRGRGVATALKMLGVRYAKSKGGTKIMTHNDSRNGPMLAVNTRLGYEPRPGLLLMNKVLTPDT